MMQQTDPPPRRIVTVVGRGTLSVKPDLAELTVGVQASARTAGEATRKVNATMEAVLAALRERGVASEDVQTLEYQLGAEHDHRDAVSGYRAANIVRCKLRDVATLGMTLDAVVAAGANEVYGVRLALAEPGAAEKRARASAIVDANARASDYASQVGVALGEVVEISELPGGGGERAAVPVETGQLDVVATVRVVYALRESPS